MITKEAIEAAAAEIQMLHGAGATVSEQAERILTAALAAMPAPAGEEFIQRIFDAIEDVREAPEEGISWDGWFHSQLNELSRKVSHLVDMRAASQADGSRALPFDRETLGRFVREAWVRWAETQPSPKPSWLVPYDELFEADKEADRQIGEAIARWTLIGDAARASTRQSQSAPNSWAKSQTVRRCSTASRALACRRLFSSASRAASASRSRRS